MLTPLRAAYPVDEMSVLVRENFNEGKAPRAMERSVCQDVAIQPASQVLIYSVDDRQAADLDRNLPIGFVTIPGSGIDE